METSTQALKSFKLPTGELVFSYKPEDQSDSLLSIFLSLLTEESVCFAFAFTSLLSTLWILGS